jgi:hypothetical protein
MDVIEKFLHSIAYKFPKGYMDMNDAQDVILLENELSKLGINLTESSLSPKELQKPYPPRNEFSSKYADRGERFLEKIQQGGEFELNDGSTIVIDPKASSELVDALDKKQYSILNKGAKVIIDTNGNAYGITSFKKTEEFGSGAGQGGGAANTAIQESSQSVVNSIAYKIKKGNISTEDLTDENIDKAYELSDVSSTLDEVKNFIKNQNSWTNTFILSANTLLSNYPNPNFQQHRGSEFVNKIYGAFAIAKKKAGISMQSDKWNPADIWMVDTSILGMEFPTELTELNATLADLHASNKLIGVSLKKTGAEAKLSTYNLSAEDKAGYTYEGSDSRPTNNNTVILYNDGSITFRTFNFAGNFAGEIKGKTAAHGKIGQGAINDILNSLNLNPLPAAAELQTKFKSNDADLLDDFYANYVKIVGNISREEFNQIVEAKDLNWLVSKYLSTRLASTIESQSETTQNEIISDIIRYASSTTKSSSVFAKIS